MLCGQRLPNLIFAFGQALVYTLLEEPSISSSFFKSFSDISSSFVSSFYSSGSSSFTSSSFISSFLISSTSGSRFLSFHAFFA